MVTVLQKNWFMLGLVAVALTVVADSAGIVVTPGLWLKQHRGPDVVIVIIFLLSGLSLDTRQVRDGVSDFRGTMVALALIFMIAPLLALCFSAAPLQPGILIGIFLVSAMPTTLSSGVVMSGAAGGNMVHSLLITILANTLAVVTIPVCLALLLKFTGDSRIVEISQLPIMIKIGTLVLIPLIAGITLRRIFSASLQPFLPYTSTCNQLGILAIVLMALCGGRPAIVSELGSIPSVIGAVFTFHLALVLAALFLTRIFRIPKHKRESVILMGGQKTLPLSVIIQVSVFPEYGLALVVCVMHHIIHLVMDAYLIKHLRKME
ncbi:bile acid:sodium symporter [Desulforhopalus singaporensis]|uniref:Solute carrier family 10 (Sodium/bile acid cotransporter), member 7 n=1 Tax=Desulforhopalus singaporensis TaxID=91360 RepID=A0A1H0J5Q3_9BACT|nr:bile acid:sodium symporter [Desulforhopalus singaporensis]SDO38922.1 solute carrier family 10 (sodium/bile acid cotransporter), member 7 [Desulforhopalus singaporensis]